jgi:hypothetical protein
MRKFKVLVLAVALIFASVTLAQAAVIGSSAADNSAVNYVHNDYTILGAGGLDFVGGSVGLVGGALAGAGVGSLGGAALGGLAGFAIPPLFLGTLGAALAVGPVASPLASILFAPISATTGIIGGAIGALAGMSLNSYVWQFGARGSLRALEGLVGGIIGGTLDTLLLGSITNMFPGGTILGALLGAEQMGPIDSILGQGIIGNTLAKGTGGLVGLIGGGILGAYLGWSLPGAVLGGLTGAALGTGAGLLVSLPWATVAGAGIGGFVGLVGGGLAGLVVGGPSGFGLGNTMDEVIQAGLTRGDNAPAKPAASVADFM